MPYITLIQNQGAYAWKDRTYLAGRIERVTNQEAYYLVNDCKVARMVSDEVAQQFVDKDNPSSPILTKMKDPQLIKIALVRVGGMGDSLILGAYAKSVKRKFPSSVITLYIRDTCELLNDLPHVDRVVAAGNANWWNLVEEIRGNQMYDMVFDNRYATKIYFKDRGKFEAFANESDECFKPYQKYYDTWIRGSHAIQESTFDMFYKSTGLVGDEDDLEIALSKTDLKFQALLEDQKYVTVHNGSDQARQTKCWCTDKWAEVVSLLKEQGYKVIQLGLQFEDKIDGATDLRGMTSLIETAGIIAGAKFHVDTEGGLVHIARAVCVRSVVLFGPTPVKCFHYDCNVAVETTMPCKGCWWSTDFWWRDCPNGYKEAKCMTSITVDAVMDGIDDAQKMAPMKEKAGTKFDPNDINEQFAMELTLNEGHYRSEPHQWNRVHAMMDAVVGPKVLEVGAGDGYCSLVLSKRGLDVTPTELSEIRIKRMEDAGLKPIKADIRSLPFPDESFDTVIFGEVLEHILNMWEGLKECERVCKKSGQLIFSLPLTERYDGILMHLWSIRFTPIMYDGKIDLGVFTLKRINGNDKDKV